jgi:hypothetical protein
MQRISTRREMINELFSRQKQPEGEAHSLSRSDHYCSSMR